MPGFTIRPARNSDAADLAMLANIGSHGLSLWYWQGAVMREKAEDALDWGRSRMNDDGPPFGWSNAAVAEIEGVVAGGTTSYLMPQFADIEKSKEPVMAPMMDLFAAAAGDWIVDNLSVFQNMRGHGVGGGLLDHGFDLARQAGVGRIALVAADDNQQALALHRSRGFEERDRRDVVAWDDSVKTKHRLLMAADLT